MCVIAVVETEAARPNYDTVESMWRANDDGGGAAWRDILRDESGEPILRNGAEVPVVRWKKGMMTEAEMQEMAATLPVPFVLHFRIQTCGGIRADMTHPFPVGDDVSLALEGQTEGNVLFHNGHWGNWQDITFKTAINFGKKLPVGPWSDTRAMAFAASVYGPGVLEFIDEKAVLFGPTDMDFFKQSAWKEVEKMWCSNDLFSWTLANGRSGAMAGSIKSQTQSYLPAAGHGSSISTQVRLCLNATCGDPRLPDRLYCAQHLTPATYLTDVPEKPTQSETQDKVAEVVDGTVVEGAGEVTTPTTPFAKLGQQRTLVETLDGKDVLMTLEQAELARINRQISKSEIRRVKRLFYQWGKQEKVSQQQQPQWKAHIG